MFLVFIDHRFDAITVGTSVLSSQHSAIASKQLISIWPGQTRSTFFVRAYIIICTGWTGPLCFLKNVCKEETQYPVSPIL